MGWMSVWRLGRSARRGLSTARSATGGVDRSTTVYGAAIDHECAREMFYPDYRRADRLVETAGATLASAIQQFRFVCRNCKQ